MANIQIPEAFEFLFQPSRYKVAYGGRGGAKSWNFARAILIQDLQQPRLTVCGREFQSSIKDSVHRLIANQIQLLGLQKYYTVYDKIIRGINGSEIVFAGFRHNIDNIKSLEGADRVWFEEAQNGSKETWRKLIPTVRKPNSEIWVSYNPESEDDETHKMFVIEGKRDSIVRKINYYDNPYFPDVLYKEMQELKEKNYDEYLHIYEGNCRVILEGAIYADEYRQAVQENRITKVPYDPTYQVHVFMDIGYGNHTSIWFVQKVGYEYRFIDFYQNRLKKTPHYISVLKEKNYNYGIFYLPHDAAAERVQAEFTFEQQFKAAFGDMNVKIVDRPKSKMSPIDAAKNVFQFCVFNQETTADGLQALRKFKYAYSSSQNKYSREPDHDEFSDGADAFGYFGLTANSLGARAQAINYRELFHNR